MSEREGIWFRFGSSDKRTPGWAQGAGGSFAASRPETQRDRDIREAKATHDYLRDKGWHAQADAIARLIRLVPTTPESER